MATAKCRQGKVLLLTHVIGIFLQAVAAVIHALPALFLDQVIGQVAGQAFGPVAAGIIDVDPVAPPVMQNLVGIGGMQDERKADDFRAQQGE